jgi:CheY-like chemotaxis protein
MLMNLCVNAEYAMRETGGLLEIRVEPVEIGVDVADHPLQLAPGAYVRLIVRDTGCGMVPDVMGRIFEPFFTTKGIGEGTGIGLSIVHGIATSYGGAVTAESRPGEGSAFAIYLPRFESPTAIETSEVAEVLPQGPSCILYVDDEALLARLGQEMLASMGYEVVATTSSAEALERFRAMPERFDLVITDQTMPSLTGENLARELRRIRADIPIILCTGFSHVIDAQKAQAMGINAFCMKPLDRGKFTRVIERVLGRR